MKIALVSFAENSAVDQVMRDLKTGLSRVRPDWDVTLLRGLVKDLDLDDYDLVHVGYAGYTFGYAPTAGCPVTTNVWHIRPDRIAYHVQHFTEQGFARFVVDDVMTLQILGQMGYTNVTPIPMAFDRSRWEPLGPPAGEFTVGCFGDNVFHKRFDVIQRGCFAAGVKAYMMVLPHIRHSFDLNPVEDVYSQIHVYAHASFTDTSSRPAMEALACGRPVISTMNDGLRRLAIPGNINFFDGSVEDLAKTIGFVKTYYEQYRAATLQTPFPDLNMIALKYAYMFEQVVEA